jgi:uncharacterized protein (DUF1330 family)
MPSYAIAQLRDVKAGGEIIEYLRGIEATLQPFGGQYLIHGGALRRVEGNWPEGDLIIIAFPDRERLEGWYGSEAYQQLLPLRLNNSTGDVIFVDGVAPGHRALEVLRAGDMT